MYDLDLKTYDGLHHHTLLTPRHFGGYKDDRLCVNVAISQGQLDSRCCG